MGALGRMSVLGRMGAQPAPVDGDHTNAVPAHQSGAHRFLVPPEQFVVVPVEDMAVAEAVAIDGDVKDVQAVDPCAVNAVGGVVAGRPAFVAVAERYRVAVPAQGQKQLHGRVEVLEAEPAEQRADPVAGREMGDRHAAHRDERTQHGDGMAAVIRVDPPRVDVAEPPSLAPHAPLAPGGRHHAHRSALVEKRVAGAVAPVVPAVQEHAFPAGAIRHGIVVVKERIVEKGKDLRRDGNELRHHPRAIDRSCATRSRRSSHTKRGAEWK